MKYGRNYGRDLSPWIAVVAVGAAFTFAGCRTGAAPASSPEAAAAQAPRSGETSSGSVVPNTLISPAAPNSTPAFAAAAPSPSPSPTEPSEITAATRRSATGLPEPLPDYMSWYPLSPARDIPREAASGHLPKRRGYAFYPKGTPVQPLPPGTILLLEEKEPAQDFIRRVSALERTEAGWEYLGFARNSERDPFATTDTSGCATCHARARDSAFSTFE